MLDTDVKKETEIILPIFGRLPALGLPVQVQCPDSKCMAYRDKEGKWRDLFTNEFLPRVLGVISA
jgi:hypothetical protein